MSDIIIDVETDTQTTPEIVAEAIYGPQGQRGEQGLPGQDGVDGEDGFSPIATVVKSEGVATITITDKNGTTTAEVYDGEGGGAVNSVNGLTGDVVLDAEDVGALPDDTSIPSKTSDLTNDSGFITGISSTDVTTALGYTPYNSSNPDGYTTNTGTVTSVNNVEPVSGNVTLSIPDAQIQSDWTQSDNTKKDFIKNKPTIPDETTVAGWGFTKNEGTVKSVNNTLPDANGNVNVSGGGGVAQIQSDWAQTDNTYVDYIKNKPNLATVATSGSYSDLSNTPTIPDAQIQSDWSQSDNTQKDYIKNKPTLATVATSGDYTDLSNTPTIPTVPTNVSAFTNDAGYTTNTGTVTSVNNVLPVSGNVTLSIPTVPTTLSSFTDDLGSSPTHTHSQYITDISGKEDILKTVNVLSTSGTIALTDNSINTITPSGAVTFTLPTVTDNTKFHQILVQVNLSTVYSINLGLGATPHYFNKTAPDLSSAGVYNLIYEYDKANQYWIGGTIEKGAGS